MSEPKLAITVQQHPGQTEDAPGIYAMTFPEALTTIEGGPTKLLDKFRKLLDSDASLTPDRVKRRHVQVQTTTQTRRDLREAALRALGLPATTNSAHPRATYTRGQLPDEWLIHFGRSLSTADLQLIRSLPTVLDTELAEAVGYKGLLRVIGLPSEQGTFLDALNKLEKCLDFKLQRW